MKDPAPANSGSDFLAHTREFKRHVDALLASWLENTVPHDLAPPVHSALFPGRRLRPILTLWLCCGDEQSATLPELTSSLGRFAIAVEAVHRASILVDDMVDLDLQRRGHPAFHVAFGQDIASLVSHLLTSRALIEFWQTNTIVLQEALQAYARMSIGELRDVSWPPADSKALRLYRDEVLPKTSQLFRLILIFSALHRRLSDIDHAAEIGERLGNVYQMANDLHDLSEQSVDVRGSERPFRVNLSLVAAVAIDSDPDTLAVLPRNVRQRIAAREYVAIRDFLLRSPAYSRAVALFAHELSVLRSRAVGLPLDWITAVQHLTDWVAKPACWNQRLQKEAGY